MFVEEIVPLQSGYIFPDTDYFKKHLFSSTFNNEKNIDAHPVSFWAVKQTATQQEGYSTTFDINMWYCSI
jgi:hypothetical protein